VSGLVDRKCKPCEGGVQPLDAAGSGAMLASLDPAWRLVDDATAIERSFTFPAFGRTMAFVNAVAWVATVEGHHPHLDVSYGRCVVRYTTSAIGGLSENDFICAAKIDRLAADQEG
jgi:4a-hydroxytetrahydrobiopterin dehydratase